MRLVLLLFQFTSGTWACAVPALDARPEVGLAASALPNIGLAGEAAYPLSRLGVFDTLGTVRLTQQFLDDEDFADDGFVSAGDWTQVELALIGRTAREERIAWHWRLGLAWFKARGEPNIVRHPGDYYGFVFGVGLRTRLSGYWSTGPEILGLPAALDGDWVIVPQLVWGVYWSPLKGSASP